MRLQSARGLIAVVAVYMLFRVAAQTVAVPWVSPVVLVLGSVALFMFLQLAIVRYAAGLDVSTRITGWLIPASVVLVVGLMFLGATKLPQFLLLVVWALRDLALILFAVSFGYTISGIIREPNILLPVAIFAAIVDSWSVNFGPLAILLASRPEVVEAAAVQVPAVGFDAPVSMIGVGDFVFLALFFAVMYRFRMNVAGAFWLGFALLTVTMFLVIFVPWLSAVPALVPIAIAVVGANTGHLKLRRSEVLSVAIVGVLLVAVLTLSVILTLRSMSP